MVDDDKLARRMRSACAVILAGGAGTRIRHLYPDLPKPMVPVDGVPFIEWVLRYLHRQGLSRFVISLGHMAEIAERYLARRPSTGCQIATVREPKPLGTGGAFVFAEQAIENDVETLLLTNGDSLVLADLSPAWQLFENDSIDGVVVGLTLNDASRYGRLEVASDNRLLRFSEKLPGAGVINAGIYLFRRRALSQFPSHAPLSMEHEVFPALLARSARLMVYRCQAPFLDIGTPESVAQADAFIRRHFPLQVAA
jgi:D-glycero-alpha-D-manno-heptose 1-phosphate guanylyltransferase